MQLLLNGMNVGTELTSLVLMWNGNTMNAESMAHVKGLNLGNQRISEILWRGAAYQGLELLRTIPHGWELSLLLTRFNGNPESLVANLTNAAQSNGQQTYFNIYSTHQNTQAGNQDEFLWQTCALKGFRPGNWETMEVDQEMVFNVQKMIPVGNPRNIFASPPAPGTFQ